MSNVTLAQLHLKITKINVHLAVIYQVVIIYAPVQVYKMLVLQNHVSNMEQFFILQLKLMSLDYQKKNKYQM
jgi:hypothetical protein